jgi:hypothetical protein
MTEENHVRWMIDFDPNDDFIGSFQSLTLYKLLRLSLGFASVAA